MSSAKVQFMITNAMRAILVDDLDYLDAEVDVMRPEIAAQLIETRTKRPFGDRPMPEAWKRGGTMPQRRGGGALSNNLVKLFLAGVCCLGAAVMSGRVSVGTLLGGAPLGRKPLKKLSSEMKSTKKRKSSSKKRRKKTAAA
jgi:hypothetical protein